MFSTKTDSTDVWQSFRRQMPVSEKWAYFDHAAVAPLPARTAAAIARFSEQASLEGDTVWPSWSKRVEQTRSLAARLLNADAAEVALVHSTSEGLGLVAEGFPWREGDNVVTLDNEFPSNQYPWLHLASRGVEARRIAPDERGRIDLDRLAAACDERTRLVSVSWVGYASGWRCDLDALAEVVHQRGALLVVDAIQGLGVFPLDVKTTPIDFLAADGHKWLLGPEGAGLFYLRREHLDLLRPLGVGWHSVAHASDYNRIELNFKPSAARFEGGSQNMVGFLALAESLELLLELGTQALSERIIEVTDLACRRLEQAGAKLYSPREGNHRSGIVSFELPGQDALSAKNQLAKEGVVLSARGGRLRLAAHAYNDASDIERLVAALPR
ncbi:MAG: aminotransferase class V-fold PLP-dependent enzyme [Planctomycetota bacterium]|nr:MAG: aminotransferase class V-fold PLP-dependent enzyme [Planctomycetota bacterium]